MNKKPVENLRNVARAKLLLERASLKISYIERAQLTAVATPSKFSNHNFRSGGATFAANLNVPDWLFKVHGRWKSDSAKDGYVHHKLDSRLYVPLHIGI